jgi:hypothetical protein
VPAPPAPAGVKITYDEQAVTVAWQAPPVAATADLLPSTPIGAPSPAFAFNVYEVKPAEAGGTRPRRLTESPVREAAYRDSRITWGAERCYAVRTVEILGDLSVESAATTPKCVTLTDTFPPAAPTGLTAVAAEGAISLIWQPNHEPDLAGYLVFRGVNGGELQQATSAPIQDTTYHDNVQTGLRFVYAVRAVDKAGNVSPLSNRVEEVPR